MTCKEAVKFIARFADAADSLDVATRAGVDAHLEGCAACRTELDTQRVVSEWLRTRPADRVSPAFAARLAARLDDVSGWFGIADWRVWTLRLAPVAAVLAAAIVLGSESSTPQSVTLEDWSVGEATSSVSLLWRADVTSESLMETMLTGELPATTDGGAGNVR
jgi:hypothetical protein